MFGFWKKKGGEIPEEQQWQRSAEQRAKERQEAAEIPQALRTLGQDFLPEELEVLAVTGANPFSGSQGEEGEGLWPAFIGLTAWMEADGPELHQGAFRLETIADNQLMPVLRQRARPDFIIRFRARRSEDGTRLLLLDLPEPGFDPELKAILDEQKKPVSTWVEGLGTFTLNRTVDWFEATVDWLGSEIALDFDRGVPEEMASAQETGRALMASQADWDHRVRSYAAQELLSLANDWAADAREEEDEDSGAPLVTQEQFMERMELESIQLLPQGGFEFWFNDGDLFWGHSIHVTGSLESGPESAQMEG